MEPITIHCRPEDIKRVRIQCRCGATFVVEIPKQVVSMKNFFPCTGCPAAFIVQQRLDGFWDIQRALNDRTDSYATPVRADAPARREDQKSDWKSYTGLRIRITDGAKIKRDLGAMGMMYGANPHPEHVGKFGRIVGEENCGGGFVTPKILLDDGTELTGAECWWEPVTA